jgi:hypothetical protein
VLSACAEAAPDPVLERLRGTADPRAAEVVAGTLEAYGGYAAWSARRSVEYAHRLEYYGGQKTPQAITRQIHRFSLGPELRAYIEDVGVEAPQIVRLDGEALEVSRGGLPVTDPGELEFPQAFVRIARWSFMQPWNLLDPSSRIEIRSGRTPPAAGIVPPGPCDVVRLTLQADWHDFYVSRLNRLIDRVHSYRAEDAAYRVTIWSDHRRYDGVRVATRRATHASDATGAVGPLEVVVEYADVRFDIPLWDDPAPAPSAAESTSPQQSPVSGGSASAPRGTRSPRPDRHRPPTAAAPLPLAHPAA